MKLRPSGRSPRAENRKPRLEADFQQSPLLLPAEQVLRLSCEQFPLLTAPRGGPRLAGPPALGTALWSCHHHPQWGTSARPLGNKPPPERGCGWKNSHWERGLPAALTGSSTGVPSQEAAPVSGSSRASALLLSPPTLRVWPQLQPYKAILGRERCLPEARGVTHWTLSRAD